MSRFSFCKNHSFELYILFKETEIMRKNKKFIKVVAAAVLATAPIVSLASSINLVQATQQSRVTKPTVTKHFLSGLQAFSNDKKLNAGTSINNISIVNHAGTTIESNIDTLPNGKYTLKAEVTVMGLTPTTTDRSINIVNGNRQIVGSASVNANSSIAEGYIDFEFTVANGKLSGSSLGTVAKSSKKATKKSHKKSHKKSYKKSRKNSHKKVRKSHKRAKKSTRRK